MGCNQSLGPCVVVFFFCPSSPPPPKAVECASVITLIVMLMDTLWLSSQYISAPGALIYIITFAEVSQFVALVILQSCNWGSSWQKPDGEMSLNDESISNQVSSFVSAFKKTKKKTTLTISWDRITFSFSPFVSPPQYCDPIQQAGVPRVEPPDAKVGRVAGHCRAGC